MLRAAHRTRNQAPPPRIVFEALTDPDRDPVRPWLLLAEDEQRPEVLEAVEPVLVVWSSLWTALPDARIRFDLASDGSAGTRLGWTLQLTGPLSGPAELSRLRRRLNTLVNGNLRESFDQ